MATAVRYSSVPGLTNVFAPQQHAIVSQTLIEQSAEQPQDFADAIALAYAVERALHVSVAKLGGMNVLAGIGHSDPSASTITSGLASLGEPVSVLASIDASR